MPRPISDITTLLKSKLHVKSELRAAVCHPMKRLTSHNPVNSSLRYVVIEKDRERKMLGSFWESNK